MNLATLLALLTLTLTDPTGDAIGDGTLEPPTSPVYANVAMFDLQEVNLEVNESGAGVLRLALGALGGTTAGSDQETEAGEEAEGAAAAASGEATEAQRMEEAGQFDVSAMLAVVDVYLDTGVGGADKTLDGPNMLLPAGAGWHFAVRVSAEGAWGITYVGPPGPEAEATGAAPPAGEGTEDGDEGHLEEPQTLNYVPLVIERNGNVLSLSLPWTFEPEAPVDVYAMTGVHDPFSPSGWRQISAASSPWAFSGGEQPVPVIDLLAPDAGAQSAALQSGILPPPERPAGLSLPLSPWLWLMIAGLGLALAGLVLRGRVAAPGAARAATSEAPEVADDEPAPRLDAATQADNEPTSGDAGEVANADEHADEHAHENADEHTDEDVDVVSTLLDMNHSEALEPAAPAPGAAPEPQPPASRSAFSTAVDESYLDLDEDVEDVLYGGAGADELESFWHPGSRGRKTLVEQTAVKLEESAPASAEAGGAVPATEAPEAAGSTEGVELAEADSPEPDDAAPS